MQDISLDEFMKGQEVPATTTAEVPKPKKARPFKDEDIPEYTQLVKDAKTTPTQLAKWMSDKGYGAPSNAAEILTFARRNPTAEVNGTYVSDQPDPVEYPKLNNAPLPSWLERVGRSASENFSDIGEGINGWLHRGNDDITEDQAARSFGVNAGWSTKQIEDSIEQSKLGRGRSIKEARDANAIRNNDEALREEGKGVDKNGKAKSGLGGKLRRGSADLLGGLIGDANPSYAIAPELGGLAEALAPALGKIAAPIIARATGQGIVQGATNAITQNDEVDHGLQDKIDPVEIAIHAAIGAGLQGGAEGSGKLVSWLAKKVKEPSAFDKLIAEGIDPRELPEGVSQKDALVAVKQLAKVKEEAAAFKPQAEPEIANVFPTEETRAADAEAWGKSLGAPEARPAEVVEPVAPVQEAVPEVDPKAARAEAEAAFKTPETTKPLTTKEFTAKLTKDADEFLKRKTQEDAANVTDEVAPSIDEFNSGDPVPVDDVVDRLTDAMSKASTIESKVQRRLYSEERKQRLAKATAYRKANPGEEGLRGSLAMLKGELPKADFEGVRHQFTDEDVDTLFNYISESNQLSGFEPINAQVGLRKLLDGQLPTRSELKLLGRVFPPKFLKAALKHKTLGDKVGEGITNALNLPRSVMSTFDLSAPFTQGVFLIGRKEFWTNFHTMFKSFASEKAFNGIMDGIKSNKNYPYMEEGNLALTDIGSSLSEREEKFMSNWAERIPIFGRGVKASERAYTGFLNKLRADTFSNLLNKYKAAGIDIDDDPKLIKDLGDFINNATGRGNLDKLLGEGGNSAAPLLSGALFSPRLMASRVNMLNPVNYIKMHPAVRKEALKSLLSFGTIMTSVLALAKAGGAEVETDPKSSDFAKIKVGDTRYNILGGFGPYLTLASRLVTGEKKTIKGEVQQLNGKGAFGGNTRSDVSGDFLRSKLSPVASYVVDMFDGKNMVGEPFEAKKDLAERFVPMFVQDLSELIKEEGVVKGGLMSIPGLFGVGSQTYEPKITKKEFEAGTPAAPGEDKTQQSEPEISLDDFMKGTEVK